MHREGLKGYKKLVVFYLVWHLLGNIYGLYSTMIKSIWRSIYPLGTQVFLLSFIQIKAFPLCGELKLPVKKKEFLIKYPIVTSQTVWWITYLFRWVNFILNCYANGAQRVNTRGIVRFPWGEGDGSDENLLLILRGTTVLVRTSVAVIGRSFTFHVLPHKTTLPNVGPTS